MMSIIFNQGIIAKDIVEKPIDADFVMISTQKVLLGVIENSVYLGFLWVRPWRVLGSIGIGKIDAVGLDVDNTLQGKTVLVLPYSQKYGGIGTEIDGILSEKATVPSDSIIVISPNYSDKILLYPFASIALQIKEIAEGKDILVIGSGFTSLLTYLALSDSSNIGIYSDTESKIPGIQEVKKSDKKWDIVVISTMRSWARVVAEKLVKDNGKIIIPKFMNSWPTIVPHNTVFIYPKKRDDVAQFLDKYVTERIFNENIEYSDDIINSIPTPKNGVIVEIKSLKNYISSLTS